MLHKLLKFVVYTFLVATLVLTVFALIDEMKKPIRVHGEIIDKNYTPMSSNMEFNPLLKISMMKTTPAQYRIKIQTDDGKSETLRIEQATYKAVHLGDIVTLNRRTGKLE